MRPRTPQKKKQMFANSVPRISGGIWLLHPQTYRPILEYTPFALIFLSQMPSPWMPTEYRKS